MIGGRLPRSASFACKVEPAIAALLSVCLTIPQTNS